MTSLAVDWVTMSTPEFVGWTWAVGVRLPFPLSAGAVSFVESPDPAAIEHLLEVRGLQGSEVLEAARTALADPRLLVYAVRATVDLRESKYVSLAGQGDDAVLILLDPDKVALRRVAETELAAGVVGSMPQLAPLAMGAVEVPVRALQAVDDAIAAGALPRTVHIEMSNAGLPPALMDAVQRLGPRPTAGGVLGAVGFGAGEPRLSTRSASWREYDSGAVLQVERGTRHGESVVELSGLSIDGLFRAAVDAVSSVPSEP